MSPALAPWSSTELAAAGAAPGALGDWTLAMAGRSLGSTSGAEGLGRTPLVKAAGSWRPGTAAAGKHGPSCGGGEDAVGDGLRGRRLGHRVSYRLKAGSFDVAEDAPGAFSTAGGLRVGSAAGPGRTASTRRRTLPALLRVSCGNGVEVGQQCKR